MRKWIIAVALLLTVPMVGAAAVIARGPEAEQLVEGHTVFTVIQTRNATAPAQEEFAAAVAVLVRENIAQVRYPDRFPGVLWFNDQYLVAPSGGDVQYNDDYQTRYPCGAVIAVNQGDPVPLDNGVPHVPSWAVYVESYKITDPNDKTWDVDKWRYDRDTTNLDNTDLSFMWTVKTLGSTDAQYVSGDNGSTSCQTAVQDTGTGCGIPLLPFTDDTPQDPVVFNRSDRYHDDGGYSELGGHNTQTAEGEDRYAEGRITCVGGNSDTSGTYPSLKYNAVLYFFLGDLTAPGTAKNHNADTGDATGCQPNTYGNAWPCPGGDDDREGYSHRYSNANQYPLKLSEGRGNHGGSAGCGTNPDGTMKGSGVADNVHATCNVDIFFGKVNATLPTVRSWRVFDLEGTTAPYHCHSAQYCNEEDVSPYL